MGDRANYAIRDNGAVLLHYSHWGAVTVAEDIFWGPARTEEFVRQNEVSTEWLDEVWAQGGIALDKDNRHLTYYCYEWPLDEDMRKVYDSVLAETWAKSGWTVQRAQQWSDVACAVGVDRATVRAEPSSPAVIAWEELGKNLKSGSCCAIVSMRTGDGWTDRAIDFVLPGVLMNGPELLDRLPSIADLSTLRAAFGNRRERDTAKTPGDWIDEFCAIDSASRSMRVSLPDFEEQWFPFLPHDGPGGPSCMNAVASWTTSSTLDGAHQSISCPHPSRRIRRRPIGLSTNVSD